MRLGRGSASVSELSRPFALAKPTLLQHIRVLERSGLISTEKIGRVRTCAAQPASIRATEVWLAKQRSIWEGRLDRMEAYIVELHIKEAKHGKHIRKK
jgi:DNA-binding transcriptional ArsR family regulator